jgi:hypothetical protein
MSTGNVNDDMNLFAKRTVQIGSIHVCYPAFVTLICGLIISILICVSGQLWLGILTFGVFLVTTYNVNCVVVGNCTTWAWILMFVYIFYVLSAVSVATGLSKSKNSLYTPPISMKSSKRH